MKAYTQHVGGTRVRATATPQTAVIPGRDAQMAQNNAGGFSFVLDNWARLDRFLVLGTDGGTYYAAEREHTVQAADAVKSAIREDGRRVVRRVVEISVGGRAPKNDAAVFTLALVGAIGDDASRAAAYAALPQVARTGTHLMQFADASNGLRGWGRGLRNAIGNWYTGKSADSVAYQMVKYQNRGGWSHRDLLRLAHTNTDDAAMNAAFAWAVKGTVSEAAPRIIHVYEAAKAAADEATILRLISDEKLTWEFVPGQWLGSKNVWDALLPNLPMTATLRNLGRLSANGVLANGLSAATKIVVDRLTDGEALKKARVHPIAVLSAMRVYAQGQGVRGDLRWTPVALVTDALNDAFYASFGNVEASGKPTLLALDVSGSMGWGEIAGVPGLTPREASAAMCMVTMRAEPAYEVIAFTGGYRDDAVTQMNLTPSMRLDQVVKAISNLSFGTTDCSLPMVWAQKNKVGADAFVVYTDNETYAGKIHPSQALVQYRQATGRGAKMAVVGMTATGFSIADPNDAGMLDVVGFDTSTPNLMAEFFR